MHLQALLQEPDSYLRSLFLRQPPALRLRRRLAERDLYIAEEIVMDETFPTTAQPQTAKESRQEPPKVEKTEEKLGQGGHNFQVRRSDWDRSGRGSGGNFRFQLSR